MRINKIHYLTKKALKGDINAAKTVLRYLSRYQINAITVSLYLIVYQIIMNLYNILEECKLCNGKCCREGGYIPLYQFDIDELNKVFDNDILKYFIRIEDKYYYIPRPCPFLKDYICTIHNAKPYACLSYPFASEDLQINVLTNIPDHGYPQPAIPYYCSAGFKIWNIITNNIDKFRSKRGRIPKPIELLEMFIDIK